jgi:hypothetical protein
MTINPAAIDAASALARMKEIEDANFVPDLGELKKRFYEGPLESRKDVMRTIARPEVFREWTSLMLTWEEMRKHGG